MTAAARTIMRQLQEVHANPVEGVVLKQTDELNEIEAEVKGPEDTPYTGGTFMLTLVLGENYPETPPKGYFRTKIFHPNVSEKGEICVNTLKKDWSPDLGLRHIFAVIRCLLIEPNPESALNEEAGRLLLEDYAGFAKRAKMMTSVHALGLRAVESTNTVSAGDKKSVDKRRALLKRL
jgi:ubiquitin-conjugating enzyme E2 S